MKYSSRGTSTKTRIETLFSCDHHNITLSSRGTSTKTRIETDLSELHTSLSVPASRGTSTKTRIETMLFEAFRHSVINDTIEGKCNEEAIEYIRKNESWFSLMKIITYDEGIIAGMNVSENDTID